MKEKKYKLGNKIEGTRPSHFTKSILIELNFILLIYTCDNIYYSAPIFRF